MLPVDPMCEMDPNAKRRVRNELDLKGKISLIKDSKYSTAVYCNFTNSFSSMSLPQY